MNKLRIAIIGLNFGRHVLKNLTTTPENEYMELAAVCDLDEEKAKKYSEEYGVPYFTDMDELLKQDDIPTIGLYTGPFKRSELLDKIISAGKDVMTTKPFELDCSEALKVLKKAESLGRIIHLNSPNPCLPNDLALAKEWSVKHDLGTAVACQLSVWVRYHEQPDGSWLDDPEKCPVAPVFRLGIYLINDLVSIFGEAEKITVLSSRLFTRRPTVDQGQLSILFKNGAMATIFASFCVEDGDQYQNGMTLNYERGTVYRNVGPQRDTKAGDGLCEMSLVMGSGKDPESRTVVEYTKVEGQSGFYQWENFYKAVAGEKIDVSATPEKIVAGLRIIEALSEANKGDGVATVKSVYE